MLWCRGSGVRLGLSHQCRRSERLHYLGLDCEAVQQGRLEGFVEYRDDIGRVRRQYLYAYMDNALQRDVTCEPSGGYAKA